MEYAPPIVETNLRVRLRVLSTLFKMRIVSLLLLAGTGGAFLAAGGFPGFAPLLWMALTGGLAALCASAMNQYLERNSDVRMRRTHHRPLVNGAITRAGWVPFVGLALILVPSLLMLPFNPALSFWSVSGAVIYVAVYTIWLKPRTMLNIVIGGFAGTCAVLSGGAAVGTVGNASGWMQAGVLVLGLLIFLWTPTHFWGLALMCREDYVRVGMPMLPAQVSPRRSAWWILLHAVATGFAALALGMISPMGWLYTIPVAGVTVLLFWRCVKLLRDPSTILAKQVFLASNSYLAVVLLLICLDAIL
jgi:protoheme IX farnesyltransferase